MSTWPRMLPVPSKAPKLGSTFAIAASVTPIHSATPFHNPSQNVVGMSLPFPTSNSVKSAG